MDALLEDLSNFGGPLSPEKRADLRQAVLRPSLDQWDVVYGFLVSARLTVWQAVIVVDDRCPRSLSYATVDLADRWNGYYPDSFTLRRALDVARIDGKEGHV